MRKKGHPEDLSVDELRRMLVEKRRSARHERLEHFRRTGRVVTLVSDTPAPTLESLRATTLEEEASEGEPKPRSRLRRILDNFLLVVEVSAILVFVVTLLIVVQRFRTLNQETAQAMAQPTLTPTPLIMEVVLPSGHTPPDSPGGAQPNEAEIPEHLRPLVQSLGNIPVPTSGPGQATRIQIPAINVDAPIVQGDGWEQLKKGVGQHIGSANPGDNNNVVLTAHDDVFGEIFRDLDRLKPGDQVVLFTSQRSYTYIVTGSAIVEPTHVESMAPTTQAVVTLISCYPYMKDNKRIIVTAFIQSGSH